ncbi:hypothetical protein HY733_02565 [Candidatus Uhrbacteria bacterium]|nr:hypothetical protein [Candidatus Uhrbacteria bacterium]
MWKFVLRLYALNRWLLSRRKNFAATRIRVGIFALIGTLLFHVPFTSAQAAATGSTLNVDSILQAFANFAYSIAATLTKMIVLVIDVTVPIMTFNNFVGNPVVKAGWAIVRDTVNMFFVVILIIIAFGTIFGHSKFKWQQQVPRLLTMAIVVNFSKTLCGIMIDFGQVIMLTFANALREIAAGNFIQLLGLNQIYSVSQNSDAIKSITEDGGKGASAAFDFFASGLASVVLVFWVLATLIILVAILLFRIIMLWILVVIAPLAWFVKGTEGIIDSKAYAEWWGEFKCMVGIGPILAFFLWLTLAVAGAGNIAANSGFDVNADSNNANFTSSLLEVNNFLSFLIGIAMLMAGFKAATQFCSGAGFAGGKIGQFIDKAKSAPRLAAGVASVAGAGSLALGGLGLKYGGLGLRAGARGLAATPGALAAGAKYVPGSARAARAISSAKEGVKKFIGEDIQTAGKVLGKLPLPGGRALERAGIAYTAKAKDEAAIERTKETNKVKEAMKGKSRAEKLALMQSYATQVGKGASLSVNEDAQYKALLDEAMSDKRMQKEARATGLLQKAWEQKGNQFEQDNRHDSAKLDQINDFKKSNADITKSAGLISTWEDVKNLSDDALKDEQVRERLKHVKSDVRGTDGELISAYDAVAKGVGGAGDTKKQALTTAAGERFERMTDTELARVSVKTLTDQSTVDGMRKAFEAAMRSGDSNRAQALITGMGDRYKNEKDATKKMSMLSAIDATAGSLKGAKTKEADNALRHLDRVRTTIERESPPPISKLEEGESGEAYAQQMKNASPARIASAFNVLSQQMVNTKQEVDQKVTQRDNIVGEKKAAIQSELEALAKTLAESRANIDKELKDKTKNLQIQWLAATRKFDLMEDNLKKAVKKNADNQRDPVLTESQKNESAQELNKAVQEKQKAEQEANALREEFRAARSKSDIPADREKAVESDERVKKIQVEIETKTKQLTGLKPEEMAEVKALNERIGVLTAHIEQIGKARGGFITSYK